MTINRLLAILSQAKPELRVHFDFCDCVPTQIASWRGVYAEPALGWEASGYHSGDITVASLIKELQRAIDGRSYGGWKGGDFYYTGDETLHIDNFGQRTQTEILGVDIFDWCVIIVTARIKKFGELPWPTGKPVFQTGA